MASQVKILCTGDLHLGRTSSKCLLDGEESAAHSTREAWARIVDCAVNLDVDLLLLSGDIADDGSNQYEAMGPFEAGIRRLADHGIPVFMVAGNHDARALPRLSGLFSGSALRLLGRGGRWEQACWPSEEAPQLCLAGWSFPVGKVNALPLEEFPPRLRDDVPCIALAHADYRAGGSSEYAPVKPEALRAQAGVDLWLLGHLHFPEKLDGSPIILNPGSPQALDPGEPGVHGPWLLEMRDGRICRVEQLPLSSVAYHALTLDVSGLGEEDELAACILQHLAPVEQAYQGHTVPRLSCRLRLTGRTGALSKLCEDVKKILQEQPLRDAHNIFLEQVDLSGVGPNLDLGELRRRPDIIGTLAGLLSDLEAPGVPEDRRSFLRGAEEQARRVTGNAAYRDGVPQDGLPAPEVLVQAECRRLLDALLRQEEGRA
ncbi:MAG: metallophosphoesterase family protein [Armatimonadota bacterium]